MNNLYGCLECREQFVSDKVSTLDGQRCPVCRGPLAYIGETEREVNVVETRDRNNIPSYRKKKSTGSLTVDLGINGMEEAMQQLSQLKRLCCDINTLQQRIIKDQERINNILQPICIKGQVINTDDAAEFLRKQLMKAINEACGVRSELLGKRI